MVLWKNSCRQSVFVCVSYVCIPPTATSLTAIKHLLVLGTTRTEVVVVEQEEQEFCSGDDDDERKTCMVHKNTKNSNAVLPKKKKGSQI